MEGRGRGRHLLTHLLAYAGFVSLGLPDGLLGVAWPSMRSDFGVPLEAVGGVLIVFTAGYLASTAGSGRLLRAGVGTLLSASCLLTGLSLVAYATAPGWLVLNLASFTAGAGAGSIDAGMNTYAALHFTPRTLNWLHASYGIGASAGPALMTAVLAADGRWQAGYAAVAVAQLFLAVAFSATRGLWEDGRSTVSHGQAASAQTLRLPGTWLGIAMFAVQTGFEASISTWLYTLLTESRGVPLTVAGISGTAFWGALTAGRILAGGIAPRFSPRRLLVFSAVGMFAGAGALFLDAGIAVSGAAVLCMGLCAAPVFPMLVATTPQRVSQVHTANAVGFQMAAAVLGSSLVPAALGLGAERYGLEFLGAGFMGIAAILMLLLSVEARYAETWGASGPISSTSTGGL